MPAGGVEIAEQFKRGPHRGGIGVVGIVDDRRPADLQHLAAHRQRLKMFQGVGDLVQVEAHHPAHGDRRQRGGQVVAAPDGDAERRAQGVRRDSTK